MDCLWAKDSHWVSTSSSVGATGAGKLEGGPCPLPSRTYNLVCSASHFRFPCSLADKESICSTGDPGSIPGLGRSPGEGIGFPLQHSWASLVAQLVKNLPAMQETWVWSLGWEASVRHYLFLKKSQRAEKEYIYIYIFFTYILIFVIYLFRYLNHLAIYQKLRQHCKSTILQKKKKKVPKD